MQNSAPGSTNIGRGLIGVVAGPISVFGWHLVLGKSGGLWLYSVSVLGGILLLIGIGERIRYETLPPAKKIQKQVEASRAGLLRTMDAVKKERQSRDSLSQPHPDKATDQDPIPKHPPPR